MLWIAGHVSLSAARAQQGLQRIMEVGVTRKLAVALKKKHRVAHGNGVVLRAFHGAVKSVEFTFSRLRPSPSPPGTPPGQMASRLRFLSQCAASLRLGLKHLNLFGSVSTDPYQKDGGTVSQYADSPAYGWPGNPKSIRKVRDIDCNQ